MDRLRRIATSGATGGKGELNNEQSHHHDNPALVTSILSSCSLFSSEPSPDQMKTAVAKWQKLEVNAISGFSKKSCEAGRISYLYNCQFEMTIKTGPLSSKSPIKSANFVSHDSGTNWLAYP